MLLKGEELARFDADWGLDSNGRFLPSPDKINTEKKVWNEMKRVMEESKRIAELLDWAEDDYIGLEILHLFVMDELGHDTKAGKIFASKSQEDFFKHTDIVTRRTMVLAAFVLLCLNTFFVTFTILRAYERGIKWQKSFLVACIVQTLLEKVLLETMVRERQ